MKKIIRAIFGGAIVLILCICFVIVFIRYRDNIIYRHEIRFAKNILMQPLLSEKPNPVWIKNFEGRSAQNRESTFYFFKVWFTEAEVSKEDIESGFLKWPAYQQDDRLSFDLFYKRDTPEIQCRIYSTPNGSKVNFSFPLNNCLFNPDYNSDNTINQDDVKLALEQLAQRKNAPHN